MADHTHLRVNLVSFRNDGHRPSYNEVLSAALAKEGIALESNASSSDTDFFPMLDDNKTAFFRMALLNSISRRRTVALFFRPMECFLRTSVKYRIKNLLFRTLRLLPNIQIITILPFSVEKRFATVAHNWINDPQFWDLRYLSAGGSAGSGPLSLEVRRRVQGRTVIAAMGAQNKIKGFEYFARIWLQHPELRKRYLFVAAGNVSEDCQSIAEEFAKADGLLFDRFVSDSELLELYHAADHIWSCYAPNYNQSSGIFGRAFQLAKPSIVREGSLLVTIATNLDHPHLALPFNAPSAAARLLLQWTPGASSRGATDAKVQALHRRDIATLVDALAPQRQLYAQVQDNEA